MKKLRSLFTTDKNTFSVPIFLVSMSIAGIVSLIIFYLVKVFTHFTLSYWIIFIIAVVTMLINGIIAGIEDDQPGGFNNPIEKKLDDIRILQRFRFARISWESGNRLLIRAPWLPWQRSRSDKEMYGLLRELIERYARCYVLLDKYVAQDFLDMNESIFIRDDGAWFVVDNENRDDVLSNLYVGDWAMLFASHDINVASIQLSPMEMHVALQKTGADLGIYSYPDDLEWEVYY